MQVIFFSAIAFAAGALVSLAATRDEQMKLSVFLVSLVQDGGIKHAAG